MNFPDTPLIEFLYWLINSPGNGGVAVAALGIGIVTSVGLVLRWVSQGGQEEGETTYAYPTTALHKHDE